MKQKPCLRHFLFNFLKNLANSRFFSGLVLSEEELLEFDFAGLDLDDAGDTREERIFRMWINSLNIDGLYINDLFADLCDGLAILKVIWTRFNLVS